MKRMKSYCPRCLRPVAPRNIPNRGVVMCHQNGDGKNCESRASYIREELTELKPKRKRRKS